MKGRGAQRLLVAVALLAALPAAAQDERLRALSAELAVIAGDARALAAPTTAPRRRAGLAQRIASSLGSLGMTVRDAFQANPGREQQFLGEVQALRALFNSGDVQGLSRKVNRLMALSPLDISYFEPLEPTPLRMGTGRSLYRQLCKGCHEHPDPQALNPAPDLFAMAATEPRGEFVARLLGGIHGDRTTTLENPFSDEEIASLMVYLTDQTKEHKEH